MCDKPICLLFLAQSDPGVSPMAEDSQSSEKRASMQDWRSFPYFLLEDDSTGRFSKCLMPRMLLRSTGLFNQRPFFLKGFELQKSVLTGAWERRGGSI